MNDDPDKKKVETDINNFENALNALEESVSVKELSELERDGMIQRFEFVFELLWKSLKHALEKEGIRANSPKSAISGAYHAQWISDEKLWLSILKDRNSTTHVYDREMAVKISERIRVYTPEIRKLLELLKDKNKDN